MKVQRGAPLSQIQLGELDSSRPTDRLSIFAIISSWSPLFGLGRGSGRVRMAICRILFDDHQRPSRLESKTSMVAENIYVYNNLADILSTVGMNRSKPEGQKEARY